MSPIEPEYSSIVLHKELSEAYDTISSERLNQELSDDKILERAKNDESREDKVNTD